MIGGYQAIPKYVLCMYVYMYVCRYKYLLLTKLKNILISFVSDGTSLYAYIINSLTWYSSVLISNRICNNLGMEWIAELYKL